MNVDINWIKQRPHFIAKKLAEKYNLEVFYPYFYNRKVLVDNKLDQKMNPHKIYRIPNALNCNWLKKCVEAITNNMVKRKIRLKNPEVLFLCSPDQAGYIPECYDGMIIYDCMDDLVALAKSGDKERVRLKEQKVISKSNYILVTSSELKKVICERYKNVIKEDRIVLCRNAFSGLVNEEKSNLHLPRGAFKIGYFGTISTWFDFQSLQYCVSNVDKIEFHIAGPVVDGVCLPNDDRIKYHGIVKHEELNKFVDDMDCLIMPFEVNDIIKSVDPVKFYEYINFNKNIISVYYEEVERFRSFVNFYNGEDELKDIIEKLVGDNKIKYSRADRIEFLNSNTWDCRCKQIEQIIEECYE